MCCAKINFWGKFCLNLFPFPPFLQRYRMQKGEQFPKGKLKSFFGGKIPFQKSNDLFSHFPFIKKGNSSSSSVAFTRFATFHLKRFVPFAHFAHLFFHFVPKFPFSKMSLSSPAAVLGNNPPPALPLPHSPPPQMPSANRRFRFVILGVATACLSMMLANILTLNFTILCMSEERARWDTFRMELGFEVFEQVDLLSPPPSTPSSNSSSPPSPTIPGLDTPRPDFNWHHFQLARHNPHLFVRLLKALAKSIDPRELIKGINLSSNGIDGHAKQQLADFVVKQIAKGKHPVGNFSELAKIRPEHIDLHNISWDGVVEGRVKVVEREADAHFSARQKALLFGGIAAGALLAIPLIGFSIDRHGCRFTFAVVCLISALATALCPLAVSMGFKFFLAIRLVQGIGFAACFPVIGAVTSAWARLTENGLFNGALTSFIQLGPVISMPLSGILCASLGWRLSFYVHSALTFALSLLWWMVYRDRAEEHPRVSGAELRLIREGKVPEKKRNSGGGGGGKKSAKTEGAEKAQKFPFKRIFSDVSVWAIWVASAGNMYAIQMMIMFAPTYIREILHYAILNVGFAAALPTLLQFVVKMVAGMCSDRLGWDETVKVRFFNSIAFWGMASFMVALAFTPPEHYRLALLFIVLCVTVLGFNTGGFFKSATLIGRQYAYFIGAKIQVIMCVAMLTVPMVVYSLTPTNSPSEWSLVFILHALFLIISNALFCLIGSGRAAPFTRTASEAMANGTRTDGKEEDEEAAEVTKPLGREGEVQ